MKLVTILGAMLVLGATGALAAEVPLSATYGDEKGCAAGSGASGAAVVISPQDVRFEGSVCPYTGVAEATPAAEGEKAWDIKLACESGHEEVIRGTLKFTEKPADKTLNVALVDGAGPAGDFTACDASETPKP